MIFEHLPTADLEELCGNAKLIIAKICRICIASQVTRLIYRVLDQPATLPDWTAFENNT